MESYLTLKEIRKNKRNGTPVWDGTDILGYAHTEAQALALANAGLEGMKYTSIPEQDCIECEDPAGYYSGSGRRFTSVYGWDMCNANTEETA